MREIWKMIAGCHATVMNDAVKLCVELEWSFHDQNYHLEGVYKNNS